MANRIYQLRAGAGLALISAHDLACLELACGDSIGAALLRRIIDPLPDRLLREAIHAMLDQEEAGMIVHVQSYGAPAIE